MRSKEGERTKALNTYMDLIKTLPIILTYYSQNTYIDLIETHPLILTYYFQNTYMDLIEISVPNFWVNSFGSTNLGRKLRANNFESNILVKLLSQKSCPPTPRQQNFGPKFQVQNFMAKISGKTYPGISF